jgi:hypothetical protein
MTTTWVTVAATDVKAGDRVRTPSGDELTVTRIEAPFLGRDNMMAFIEDSSERWFKRPLPLDAKVEVRQD